MARESLPQDNNDTEKALEDKDASNRVDSKQVEALTRAILLAIESGSSSFWSSSVHGLPRNRLARAATFVASTWVVFFALFSAGSVLLAWRVFPPPS